MKYHPDKEIDSLLHLLDDENESVAVYAMGELLDRESRLGDALGILQESPVPLLRRRVHQLEAAIALRRRRRNFKFMLDEPDVDWKRLLIETHLLWFDNDSVPDLERRWNIFELKCGGAGTLNTLERLAEVMRKSGMSALPESSMQPEAYCIGTVLDSKQGAASVLCAACEALEGRGSGIGTVRVLGEFALSDREGRLLLPARDWLLENRTGAPCEKWEPRHLAKYIALMLFSHAVTSDCFRYIQTIGQALSGVPDGELPETFPYPYCAAEEEMETGGNG